MFRFGGYTCHWENSGQHLHFQDTGRKVEGVKEKAVKEKEEENQKVGEFKVKKTKEKKNSRTVQ